MNEDLKLGNVLYAAAKLNLVTLNINGLRTRRKKAMLGKLLKDLQIGVAIITETHLRTSELGRVNYKHYNVIADHCRDTPKGQHIGGGVLILVHQNFSAEELPQEKTLTPQIEYCACRVFPTADPITAIDIIGTYLPPKQTGDLTMTGLHKLIDEKDTQPEEKRAPCIIGGDLNTTSWGILYQEWIHTEGIIELVDPREPTYTSGSAIDKLLFLPGRYIPSTFLPTKGSEETGLTMSMEDQFFPAQVVKLDHISDHYPIVLPVPCDAEEKIKDKTNRVRVGKLTEEEWEEKDTALRMELEQNWPIKKLHGPITNIRRLHKSITRSLNKVFLKERSAPKEKKETDPFEHFLLANIQHPEMPALLTALEEKNTQESDKRMNRIGADGWRKYLQSIRKDDTRAFFAYLAKAEGRKQQGFVPADASPMLDEHGRIVLTPKEKVALITRTFRSKFAAPAITNPQLSKQNPNNVPLPPYRNKNMGTFQPIREQEMIMAIAHLSTGKAPGPDGFPVEIYKHLTALRPYLLALLNGMYRTGDIPRELRTIFVVPITKPGKSPKDPGGKRPISLINTTMKILEGILYQRIIPRIEPYLMESQYAYRRQRGTEHHLTSVMDHVNRALLNGKNAYVISFGVAGAFDNVSHHQLSQTLLKFDVNPFTHRIIHQWLRGREFQVKQRTPKGTYIGELADISAGLPQGGIISPILWLLFFNDIQKELKMLRKQQGVPLAAHQDSVYADDITTVITSPDLDELRDYAEKNEKNVKKVMTTKNLQIQDPKTHNLLWEAKNLTEGIYRRKPPISIKTTKTRLKEQYMKSAEHSESLIEFDPEEHPPIPPRTTLAADGFPYPLSEGVKVLGVTMDEYFTLDEHLKIMSTKAQVRQGILSKVSRCTWGLEMTILRLTHDALITSLLRYAMVVVGSCAPDDLINRIDTTIINVAARRISRLPLSTRIETLHFLSGTNSYRNMYIQQCAMFVRRARSAHGSAIERRVNKEIGVILNIDDQITELQVLRNDLDFAFMYDPTGLPTDAITKTTWLVYQQSKPAKMHQVEEIPSTYFAHAPEIRRIARRKRETYTFANTHSWLDVGLQVLKRAGWWPECSQPHTRHLDRMIPPEESEAHIKTFRTYIATERMVDYNGQKVPTSLIEIISGVVRVDNIVATVVVIMANGGMLKGNGVIHGQTTMEYLPDYAHEVSVLHALRTYKDWMQQMEPRLIQKVNIRAGTGSICYQLEKWMKGGICTLKTAAASNLLEEIQNLPEWLKVETSLSPFYMPDATEDTALPWAMSMFMGVLEQYRTIILPQQPKGWTNCLPRIPMTTEELKTELKKVYERDELRIMKHLSETGSASASIVVFLELTRTIVEEAYHMLRDTPEIQQNLTEILSATRFKVYNQGHMHHIKCPRKTCFQKDSFKHMIDCYNLRKDLKKGPEATQFLVKMAQVTYRGKQGKYIPLPAKVTKETRQEDSNLG